MCERSIALPLYVVDITNAPCYPGFQHFGDEASSVSFSLNAEPSMSGGLKKACSVSDALVREFARLVHVDLVDHVVHRERREIGERVGGIPAVGLDDDRRLGIDHADDLGGALHSPG